MFRNLNPSYVGVRAPLYEVAKLAKISGFEGMDININEVESLIKSGVSTEHVRNVFVNNDLHCGGWELPLKWREENESAFNEFLSQLPSLASLAQQLGFFRAFTWILPYSDKRPFKENFDWHVERLGLISEVLYKYGCHLGLEFVATKTFRANHKYEFIYTMEDMLKLCESVGKGNIGLLLDSWHWYVSGGTLEDLKRLTSREVIYVHINDAPIGIPRDKLIDHIRYLPGETGVIDLIGFLHSLIDMGYDGPVTPEPFIKKFEKMPANEVISLVGQKLSQIWHAAGL
jgi:sugar phosphate isomerase/epimerase